MGHQAEITDASIAEKANHALWNNSLLRTTVYQEIDIAVNDGIVVLSGHVNRASSQKLAEDAVRTVPGVLGVKSYLVSDDNLVRDVAGALAQIEHAYGVKFFTGAQNGVVYLHGRVGSARVRSLAEKYAAGIPGVRGVINSVRAPGVDLAAEDQRFLHPVVGEQIYFRDGLLGAVQKVVIHPSNRRVVSMIVQRQTATDQPEPRSLLGDRTLLPEGLVVIPMDIIRYMTKSSGFLHIHSAETAKYRDFDPAEFIVPEKGWTPPYPYGLDDVLFPAGSLEGAYQTENEPATLPALFPGIQPAIQSTYSQ